MLYFLKENSLLYIFFQGKKLITFKLYSNLKQKTLAYVTKIYPSYDTQILYIIYKKSKNSTQYCFAKINLNFMNFNQNTIKIIQQINQFLSKTQSSSSIKYRKLFNQIDTNKDGLISVEELQNYYEQKKAIDKNVVTIPFEQLKSLFQILGVANGGQVPFNIFQIAFKLGSDDFSYIYDYDLDSIVEFEENFQPCTLIKVQDTMYFVAGVLKVFPSSKSYQLNLKNSDINSSITKLKNNFFEENTSGNPLLQQISELNSAARHGYLFNISNRFLFFAGIGAKKNCYEKYDIQQDKWTTLNLPGMSSKLTGGHFETVVQLQDQNMLLIFDKNVEDKCLKLVFDSTKFSQNKANFTDVTELSIQQQQRHKIQKITAYEFITQNQESSNFLLLQNTTNIEFLSLEQKILALNILTIKSHLYQISINQQQQQQFVKQQEFFQKYIKKNALISYGTAHSIHRKLANNDKQIGQYILKKLVYQFFQSKIYGVHHVSKPNKILTLRNRKIDITNNETLDNVCQSAILMAKLDYKYLPKEKKIFLSQNEQMQQIDINFILSPNYGDLFYTLKYRKLKSNYLKIHEFFDLIYQCTAGIEYLKQHNMYFYEINPYNILIEKEPYIQQMLFRLVNFEHETKFFEQNPIFVYKDQLPFIPPTKNFFIQENTKVKTYGNIYDIHKQNIYSLGLTFLAAAVFDNTTQINTLQSQHKIQELIMQIQYPSYIKEILQIMLKQNSDERDDSTTIFQRLKSIKKNYYNEIYFKDLSQSLLKSKDLPVRQIKSSTEKFNKSYLLLENSLAIYNSQTKAITQYKLSIPQQKKFSSRNIDLMCFDGNNDFYFLDYTQASIFFKLTLPQDQSEDQELKLTPLHRPGFAFMDRNSHVIKSSLIYVNQVVFMVGGLVPTNMGLIPSKNCYAYNAKINKWNIISSLNNQKSGLHQLFYINNEIYAIEDCSSLCSLQVIIERQFILLEIYSVQNNKWKILGCSIKNNLQFFQQLSRNDMSQCSCIVPLNENYFVIINSGQNEAVIVSKESQKSLKIELDNVKNAAAQVEDQDEGCEISRNQNFSNGVSFYNDEYEILYKCLDEEDNEFIKKMSIRFNYKKTKLTLNFNREECK